MGRPITPEDLWALKRVGQPEHIAGTTACVVPVVTYDGEDGAAVSVIHRIDREGASVQLTSSDRSSSSPMPSPDGTQLAFLGRSGDDDNQVYVMPLGGGEARKVTDLPLGATFVTWIPTTNGLIVAAPLYRGHASLEATDEEKERRDGKTLPVVTEDRVYRHWKKWLAGATITHLFRVDLDDGSVHHLTEGLDRLIGLDDVSASITVSPDGGTVFFTLDDNPEPWEHFRFSIHRLPVDGGSIERVLCVSALRRCITGTRDSEMIPETPEDECCASWNMSFLIFPVVFYIAMYENKSCSWTQTLR